MKKANGRLQKVIVALMVFMGIMVTQCSTVFAAKTIKTVTVSLDTEETKSYPEVTVSELCNYELVEKVEWSIEESKLEPGDEIIATIALKPKQGYEFAKDTSVTVIGGKCGKYDKKNNGSYMFIKVTYTVKGQLPQPKFAYWDLESKEPWMAKTQKVPNADSYVFTVYDENGDVVKVYENDKPTQNFAKTLGNVFEQENVRFEVYVTSKKEGLLKSKATASSNNYNEWEKVEAYCKGANLKVNYK